MDNYLSENSKLDCAPQQSPFPPLAALRTAGMLTSDPVQDSKHWTLPELSSDIASVTVGLTTRAAMSELCPVLTRGSWYTKLTGLGLQLFMAGTTKDFTADGHLGDWQDFARGGGVYTGSRLLMTSLSLSPTKSFWDVDLARRIYHRFPAAYPMPHYRNLVIDKLGSGISNQSKLIELVNPRNFNPLNRNLWNAELAADALARGEISLARYMVQTQYGQWYLAGSTTLGFGAGREYLYLATQTRHSK